MRKQFLKIYELLNSYQRSRLFLIILMVILGMIFEMLGIGILIPILNILASPDEVSDYILMDQWDFENVELIQIALVALVLIFFFKTVYLLFLTYYQNSFLQSINAHISIGLFEKYLNMDYDFHIKNNSAELNKKIIIDISYFTSYFSSLLVLVTEFALVLAVGISVFFIEPIGATVIIAAFVSNAIFFNVFSSFYIKKWGKLRKIHESKFTKTTLESLKAIKDIIVKNKVTPFVKDFSNDKNVLTGLTARFITVNMAPRYFLEFTTVLTLVIFILFNSENQVENILPTLGIFVAAAFRTIPSINKILASKQNLTYYQSAIDSVIKEYHLPQQTKVSQPSHDDTIPFKKHILLKDIKFSYKNNNKILNGLNLKVSKGKTIGIVGKSGEGKTTLIDIILGLHEIDSGEVWVDDLNLEGDFSRFRNLIGYVPQQIFLMDSSIANNIAFCSDKKDIDYDKIHEIIDTVILTELIAGLPEGVDTIVGEGGVQLSGGQKQRIGIARALYNNPEIILLDESTSALDNRTESDFMNSLFSLKGLRTIIIVAHRIETLDQCDEIYELQSGKLYKT